MSSAGDGATTRLLVVRHGRTAWNGSRFLGQVEVPLDEVGRAQARTVAEVLGHEPVGQIWCSPLGRARETAAPLAAATGAPVVLRRELVELDCGEWQGRLKAGPEGKLSSRDPQVPLPGGESIADVWSRVTRFAEELTAAPTLACTAVVGHYLTSQLLVAALLGLPVERALRSSAHRLAPGGVLELHARPQGWRLHGYRVTAMAAAL